MNEEKTTLEIIDSSVDAAIERGLEQLGLTRDDIEIEVLDAGSRGILGLGGRQSRIRISIKGETGQPGTEMPAAAEVETVKPAAVIKETELSEEDQQALKVARDVVFELLERMKVKAQITFEQTDLLPSGNRSFDLVCANLPYIPSKKLEEVNTLGFEPTLALDGGTDGLRLIRRLLEQLPARLNCPGLVLLETEATLGAETLALANAAFPRADVRLLQDLAGLDRLVRIEAS